ncbi:MAG: hypothetical protein D6722_09615 [Bacteroidetes bacterium]|nr:MAG: hypothetical protein D6722_09615 [Bacteroidota bacterium]
MIRVPGGTFSMGSDKGYGDEKPVHQVAISTFHLAETEVTFAQYDYFCERTGREKPDDQGWGRGSRPVINVSWQDAKAYCQWLSKQTGDTYRLPSEAEWEYADGGGVTNRTKWAGTNVEANLPDYAVLDQRRSFPAKRKHPNQLGLCQIPNDG